MKGNAFYSVIGEALRESLTNPEFTVKSFTVDGVAVDIDRHDNGFAAVGVAGGSVAMSYDTPARMQGEVPPALVEACREARRTVRDRDAQKRTAARRKDGTVGQGRGGYRPELVDLSSFDNEDDLLEAWRAACEARRHAEIEAARKVAAAAKKADDDVAALEAKLAAAKERQAKLAAAAN